MGRARREPIGAATISVVEMTDALQAKRMTFTGDGAVGAQRWCSSTASVAVFPGSGGTPYDIHTFRVGDPVAIALGADVRAFLASRGFANTDGGRYFTNAADTRTQGVDFVGQYSEGLGGGAALVLTLAYNRNDTDIERIAPTPAVLVRNGFGFERVGRQERGRTHRCVSG